MTWDTGDVRNAVAGAVVECASRGILPEFASFSIVDGIIQINIQGNGKFIDSGSGMVCVSIEEVYGSTSQYCLIQ